MKFQRKFYVVLVIVAVLSVVGTWLSIPRLVMVAEGFETNFGGWVIDADVPSDPNNPGHTVEWRVQRSINVSYAGQYSLEFFIDGRQDDGTIRIERKVSIRKNAQILVKLSFYLYSRTQSFNAIAGVVACVNASSPEAESDFDNGRLGQANQVAGWKRYEYVVSFYSGSSEEVWVAVESQSCGRPK